MTRILAVDDEPQILRALATNLRARGYAVDLAGTGEAALMLAARKHPDLVILDLGLPGMDGVDVIRGLRGWSSVPIIVLSVKGGEQVKVEALDAGADDYITKPFGMDELLARVRAALRRGATDAHTRPYEVGSFLIDTARHSITQDGKELKLTPKEFELLSVLIRNYDRVMTHRTLLAQVWGGEFTEQPEYLRVFIGSLRKKIEVDPSKPRHLITEPWIGYRFIP